jgi:hypothetical protein
VESDFTGGTEEEIKELKDELAVNSERVTKFSFRALKGEIGRAKVYGDVLSVYDNVEIDVMYQKHFAKDRSYRPTMVYDIDCLSVSDIDLVQVDGVDVFRIYPSVHKDMVPNRLLTGNRVDRLKKNIPGSGVSGCYGHEDLPRVLYTVLGDEKHFYRLTDLEFLLDNFQMVEMFNRAIYSRLPGFLEGTGVFAGGNLSDFAGVRALVENIDLDMRIEIFHHLQLYLLHCCFLRKDFADLRDHYDSVSAKMLSMRLEPRLVEEELVYLLKKRFGNLEKKCDIPKEYHDPILDLVYYHFRLVQAVDLMEDCGSFPEFDHYHLTMTREEESNRACLKAWTRRLR